MKSRLAIAVALSGWLIIIVYVLYEYQEYGSDTLRHLFVPKSFLQFLFHLMVLFAPIASTIIAYLINERKKVFIKIQGSERRLRHAAREWRETFDALPHGLMLVDNEFNILKVNTYIANLAGLPIKESIHKKCYEVIHMQNRPIDNCPLVKSTSTKNTERFEYYDSKRNKYFMSSVTPLFDDKGDTIAFSHPLIDITDLKNKEEKLIQSKNAFFNMLKDIDVSHKKLQGLYSNLVIALANAIDAKSPWTRGHSERVTHYAILIAKEMGLNEKDIETLKTGGLLHDIGKLGTYDVILDKPDRLTKEEFEMVKMHPVQGEKILSPIKGLENTLSIIRSHHEKLDGTGYPDGLKGDEIPLLARILCAADAYDSMTADRPYRPSPGKEYAISEFKRCSGTQFDPEVVEAFLRVLERED